MHQISSVFDFLYKVYSMQIEPRRKLLNSTILKIRSNFQHGNLKDTDGTDLCSGLQAIARGVAKGKSPKCMLYIAYAAIN
jgi:hypothetical protein